MSLNNTSHPGGPALDELVPSRYALKVGAIDVMVVSDGVLSLPGTMLGHNADPAVRAAWLEDKFLPPDVLEWALNVVVVRSGGRTILIDVGRSLPRATRRGPGVQARPSRAFLYLHGSCTSIRTTSELFIFRVSAPNEQHTP
jgi:hypothetical protein